MPCIPVAADRIQTLTEPAKFRETLLDLITQAKERILIATLYLQDDEAGREVLRALYDAKKSRPQLTVAVFVDFHRAQRGLIGKNKSLGNSTLYRDMARRLGPGVVVYGVPVQTQEIMGVMHLKGFILDDTVLYSGASLNNVYLHRSQCYRLDRYHVIQDRHLADSLAGLLLHVVRPSPAVHPLDTDAPGAASLRDRINKFRRVLAKTHYHMAEGTIRSGEVGITPLLGLGSRDNELNAVLLNMIRHAQDHLVLFTPYFNLPGPLRRATDLKIWEGCEVTIVLGDKVANDFYIPPEEPFKPIGVLPYLYEGNLRRFCKTHQGAIDQRLLNVHLWRHEHHTFHLKGVLVDEDYALLTGNNINPRAWRLDLENGLLIHDPHKKLQQQHQAELKRIFAHTERLEHYSSLEAVESYPAPARRLLKRLGHARMDRLVNQVL